LEMMVPCPTCFSRRSPRSQETGQGDARNVVWEREGLARRGVTPWRLDMTHPAVAGSSYRMSMMPMSSWFSGTDGRRGERQRIPFRQAPKRVFCRVPCAALARGDENALRA